MERRRIVLFLLLFLGLPGILSANDSPHNEASGVGCADCHGQSLLNSQSPFYTDNRSDTAYNAICTGVCHNTDPVGFGTGNEYTGSLAPMVQSHKPGGTVIKCTVCHHNHDQDQIYTGKNEKNNFFIATGTVDTEAPTPIAYDSGTNKTTITFATLTATDGSSQWADLSLLAKKTGDGRGAMLVPNHTSRKRWPVYIIKSLDTTAGVQTITVKGQVTSASNLGIFYGQSIRRSINYDSVSGMPKSIKLYDRTGVNGFADNDTPGGDDKTPNGICQVCHTTTDHWRNDGTLSAVGVHAGMDNGVNCSNCHGHTDGFKPSCDTCHGYAPDPLVSNPGPTGSITAGVHTEHTTNQGYGCEVCHYDSVGSGSTHNNGDLKVTMGFAPPDGIPQGGSYDGQATVQYDATTTTPETIVSKTGSKNCTNLYCHSSAQGVTDPIDPPDYATPNWDGSNLGCTGCHKAGSHQDPPFMDSGSHLLHVQSSYGGGGNCQYCHFLDTGNICDQCHSPHFGLYQRAAKHVDHSIDVDFHTPFVGSDAVYTGDSIPRTAFGTCENIYCHGNYDGSGLSATPTWGNGASGACGTCHGASNNSDSAPESGSHEKHAENDQTINGVPQGTFNKGYKCTLCHEGIISGSGPTYTIANKSKHVNSLIDWSFDTTDLHGQLTADSAYDTVSGTVTPTDGSAPNRLYSTCTNVYCHSIVQTDGGGALTLDTADYRSPTWGTSVTCGDCHGRDSHSAVGNLIGSGSHTKHLEYKFTTPGTYKKCELCHRYGTADIAVDDCSSCHVAGERTHHANGQVDLVFESSFAGASALYNGTATPGDGYSTCDNTYCHSDGTSVATGTIPVNTSHAWGTVGPLGCDACHDNGPSYDLFDPKANSHVRHDFLGCESCHYTTTTNGSTITNLANHVNGQYSVSPSPTYHRNGSDYANTFDYVFDTGGGTCSNITCHSGLIALTKKWGNASLTPSSFNYNYTDQGDYGITITVGSPTCFPDPDSVTCPTPYIYNWEFSDGHIESTTSNSIHYEFGAPGPHTATLTQVAANGLSGVRVSGPINPNPPPPPPPAWYPEVNVVSGNTVEVTITGSAFGKVYVRWDWNGSSSTEGSSDFTPPTTSVQKTYPGPGTYFIRVEVLDPGHIEYDYEWNVWPATQDCSTCSTLQVGVP